MEKKWIVKVHYPRGSHTYQPGTSTAIYESKQQALAVCEVLNATNTTPGTYFMPAELGG